MNNPCAKSAACIQHDVTTAATTLQVQHITMTTTKPYAEVKKDLEARIGRLTDEIRSLLHADKVDEMREALQVAAGADGLALHYTGVHGDWLALKGHRRNCTAYLIGNVLSAVEMTNENLAAGLYAPLRVVLYENDQGGTRFEYDLPSTVFGQFNNPVIDRMAKSLDDRLAALLFAVSLST